MRKLRIQERLAAIVRGMDVPMQPELSESAPSRCSENSAGGRSHRIYRDLHAGWMDYARRDDRCETAPVLTKTLSCSIAVGFDQMKADLRAARTSKYSNVGAGRRDLRYLEHANGQR